MVGRDLSGSALRGWLVSGRGLPALFDSFFFFFKFYFLFTFIYLFIYFLAEQWPVIFWFCLSDIAVTLQAGFGSLVWRWGSLFVI